MCFTRFEVTGRMRGGIFRFKTTDGRIARSSFCHGETKD